MPADSSEALRRFFASHSPDFLEKFGIRLVAGVAIDQTEHSVVGAAHWLDAFPEEIEHLLIVSDIGAPDKSDSLRQQLKAFSQGRNIIVPRIGEPNVRKLDPQKVLSSVAPLSGWLTGRPSPVSTVFSPVSS